MNWSRQSRASSAKNSRDRLRDIYLIGDIEKDTARQAIERLRELANDSPKPITHVHQQCRRQRHGWAGTARHHPFPRVPGHADHDRRSRDGVLDGLHRPAGGQPGAAVRLPTFLDHDSRAGKWAGWQSTTAAAQHLDRLKQMQGQIYRILAERSGQTTAPDHPRHQAHGLLPRRGQGPGIRADRRGARPDGGGHAGVAGAAERSSAPRTGEPVDATADRRI